MAARPTPHHTTGPFFPGRFIPEDDRDLTRHSPSTGRRIELSGMVTDGQGTPAVNLIVELSQADQHGRFQLDRRQAFTGWGRTATDREGHYRFITIMPGPYQASPKRGRSPSSPWIRPPHLTLLILGSGIMRPLVTEVFFPDQPLNDGDLQLRLVPARLRARLFARQAEPDRFTFDIRLRGPNETPFFAIPGL
jgi:protocatechuate 3,4-dioxygenase alpha subunit